MQLFRLPTLGLTCLTVVLSACTSIQAQTSMVEVAKQPSTPCEILAAGNSLYGAGKFEQAVAVYSAAEKVDKIGKENCTESSYASLGAAYTAMARAADKDPAIALSLMRKASFYHRASVAALWCSRLNYCKYSEDFWADNSFFR